MFRRTGVRNGNFLAGPHAASVLGEFGGEVLKRSNTRSQVIRCGGSER